MKTYYIQLKDVDRWIEIDADANPSLGITSTLTTALYWQFKQGDNIVAQFIQANVVGWWTNR